MAGGTTSYIETEGETTVTVTEGSTGRISNSSGIVTVTGGIVTSDSQGIYNFAGVVNVEGGEITGEIGIENVNGIVTIKNGTITSTTSSGIGIYNSLTGTIKVEGGTISGYTGIWNDSTEIITIGENDGNVSIESPEIIGTKYGVFNSKGTLNFYDGKIIGEVGVAVYGTISNIEENYSIKQNIENSRETLQLAMIENFRIIETDITYYKLQDAIDAINSEEQTIEVLNDVIVSMDEVVSVSSSKSIILDLNGNKVENPAILNYGTLKIIDSSQYETGTISLTGESGIANKVNATSEIVGGKILSNTTKGIENNGTLILEGGSIVAMANNSFGIYNNSEGTLEVTGGEIDVGSYSRGICNDGGTLTVKGGKIEFDRGYSYGITNSGIAKIEGGNIEGTVGESSVGIYNSGILEIEEGNIRGVLYGINNEGGQTTVTGGTITGTTGIKNASTLTVTGGTITGTSSGGLCYGIISTGTIIIGEQDRNVNIENPKIIGESVGLSASTGIVNFYDGSITGLTSISAVINDIEEDYEIVKTVDEGTKAETAILQKKSSFDVINTMTQVGYYSLERAIEEAQEGEILQIVKDITIIGTQNSIEIEEDKNIAIDLNGYDIELGNENSIINNGILTIEDSTVNKEGMINSSVGSVIMNESNATLKINGGTITCYKDTTASCIQNKGILRVEEGMVRGGDSGIYNSSEGEVIIVDGHIYGESNAIYNDSIGTVTIDGGEIVGSNGIYNNLSGIIRMTGGTIQIYNNYSYGSHSSYGIYNNSTGTITIEGGAITVTEKVNQYHTVEGTSDIHNAYGIYNNSTGTITIKEGNITAIIIIEYGYTAVTTESYQSYGIYNASTGIVTIEGGNVSSNNNIDSTIEVNNSSTGIYNASTGVVVIEGGNVEGDNGMYNASTGVITVEEGYVTGDSIGINNYSTGTIIVIGGTINSNSTAISNIGKKFVNENIFEWISGTIVIGEKDGNVDIENPKIIGKGYGVYSYSNGGGIVNYYDGSITGAANQSIYDLVNDIEEGYDIIKTVDEEKNTETASLVKGTVEVVNLTSGEEYITLRKAIEEAKEGETLQIVRNITTMSTQSSIEIEAEKNIVIDLNGYNIEFGQENPIINNGTLKIEDSTIDQAGIMRSLSGNTITNEVDAILEIVGGLVSASENGIYNKGILQVDGGNVIGSTAIYNSLQGEVTLVDGSVTGGTNGIYNDSTGTILIKGGNIETTNNYSYGIKNVLTGKVEMLGGTITIARSASCGIYNYSRGIVTMSGGTITMTGTSSKGIGNTYYGTLLVDGGNIIVTNKTSTYGITNDGEMIVSNGNIESANIGISNSSTRNINSRRWNYNRRVCRNIK